jgi:hypothetical protein
LQYLCFLEKEKNKRKEKSLAWAWSSPQRSQHNRKDSTQVKKKKLTRKGPIGSYILHQEL